MGNSTLTMAGLGSMLLGVVLIIVLYTIIPVVGDTINGSNPTGGDWDASNWNVSNNADLPMGYDFWTTISGFVTLTALMLFVGGFIGVLKGLKG